MVQKTLTIPPSQTMLELTGVELQNHKKCSMFLSMRIFMKFTDFRKFVGKFEYKSIGKSIFSGSFRVFAIVLVLMTGPCYSSSSL